MSETKHTIGPWTIRYGDVSDADEGFGIASTIESGIVAECWPCATDLKKRQTMRADARLIAAAPDLLTALKETLNAAGACFRVIYGSSDPMIVDTLEIELGRCGIDDGWGKRARDLIDKAEGRSV